MSDPIERERLDIGQALHDTVCQSLGGIAILVRILARRAKAGRPVSAEDLEELASMTDRALDEARALSRNLLPVQRESAGLMAALEELAAETSRTVTCTFICETPVHVEDAPTALALYCRAQDEVRHAMTRPGVSAITMSLTAHDGRAELLVRDGTPLKS